jgi:integrase
MASPWKHPKTGMYWFRRRVPDRLRPHVGRTIVQQSLRTKNIDEAKRRFLQVAAQIDREWSDMLLERRRLTPKQMHGLAGEFYRWFVARHDEDPGSAKEWEDRAAHDRMIIRPPNRRLGGAVSLYLPQVEQFLKVRDILVDDSDLYYLSIAVANAGVQAKETLARNAHGDYSEDPREQRYPKWEQVEPKLQIRTRMLSIDEHFDGFAKESLAPASRKKYRSCLRDLARFLKTENLNEATPERLVEWKADLVTRNLDGRSIRDGYLAAARSFFKWAVGNKKAAQNPMDGIGMKVPKKAKSRKPAFTDEEARLILSETLRPDHHRASKEWSAARRWIPWICAYTGARVNELTQLRGQDVIKCKFDGEEVWVINITPDAGTTKNKEARQVPLHPHIIEQGFPDFVASRGPGPLFYDPTRNRGGSEENPQYKKVGDKLAEWVRKIGVDDPGVNPNHGWRHRFQKVAQKIRMIPEIRDGIKGHVPRTEGEEYGGSIDADVMWPEIKALPRYEVAPPTGPLPDTPARREATRKRAETRKRSKARASAAKRSGLVAGQAAS